MSINYPKLPATKNIRLFLSRFSDWYQDNRQAANDLLILLALSVLTHFVIGRNDVMERFHTFTQQHEELELDELVLTLAVISSVYVSIFAIRRWNEAMNRLKQSNTDSLTGLFNRRRGMELIEQEIMRSDRYQGHFSIILLDIDNFKTVNDTHGHLAGDIVLKAIAKVAGKTVRNVDRLIRWGGDEFIVLLPDTDADGALQVAERLREVIATTPIQAPTFELLNITASFGVTRKDEYTPDLETLIARADQAMYIAKYMGRNRVASSK